MDQTSLLDLATLALLNPRRWDAAHIRSLYQPAWPGDELEGDAVRLVVAFAYGEYRRAVAKYVRAGHDQTRLQW